MNSQGRPKNRIVSPQAAGASVNPPQYRAFHTLSRILAARARYGSSAVPEAPDWIDPDLMQAIWMPLDGGAVSVALSEGSSPHDLPSQWHGYGTGLRADSALQLMPCRAPRMQAQAAVQLQRVNGLILRGTATALMHDRLNAERHYLLTCAHVVAAADARHGDPVRVLTDAGPLGYLTEWQPAAGPEVLRTPLDAALVELRSADAREIGRNAEWLPTGVGRPPRQNQRVTLRRNSDVLDGVLKVYWSGAVDIPGVTPNVADYFLEDAIGYTTAGFTAGGDSGAPIWDENECLVGMHLGSVLESSGGGEVNAILGQIAPVLEWFDVDPWLRHGAVPDRPSKPTPTGDLRITPSTPKNQVEAQVIVAKTLWGEARSEGERGMRAVAAVIEHRRAIRHRKCNNAADVCLSFRQFSCWNDNDPNRVRMEHVALKPDSLYRMALDIAGELISGRLFSQWPDETNNATHYIASALRNRPPWLRGKTPCAVIGRHEFYNNID